MGKHDVSAELMTLNDFLFASEIDNVNMFKIEKFIQRSEIVRKACTNPHSGINLVIKRLSRSMDLVRNILWKLNST